MGVDRQDHRDRQVPPVDQQDPKVFRDHRVHRVIRVPLGHRDQPVLLVLQVAQVPLVPQGPTGATGPQGPAGSNVVQGRTAGGTLALNETTLFSGSTLGQTLVLPVSPILGTINSVNNQASVPVTVVHGAGKGMVYAGVSYPYGYPIKPGGRGHLCLRRDIELIVVIPTYGAPVWNVVAYGADATGSVDSTTAIQNAIKACGAAGGGRVYIPPGTFKISSTLGLGDGVVYTTVTAAGTSEHDAPCHRGRLRSHANVRDPCRLYVRLRPTHYRHLHR